MSQPSGYPNSTPMPSGQQNSPLGPNVLPNGQPSQWSRPPVFPQHAKLPRPVASAQNFQYPTSALTTNGIQMPNPGSLSSQSSRDPSPAPPPPSLSHSTPNLASVNSLKSPPFQRVPHLPDISKHGGSQPLQQHSRPMATVIPHGMTPVSKYSGGLQHLPQSAGIITPTVDQGNESGRGDQNNHSVPNQQQTKVNGTPVSTPVPLPSPIIRTNAQGTVPPRQESLLVEHGQEQTLNQFQNNLPLQQTERIQQQQSINSNTVTQHPSYNANQWQQSNSGVQGVSNLSSQNNNLYPHHSVAATYQSMTVQHPPTSISNQQTPAMANQQPLTYHSMQTNTYQSNSSQQNTKTIYKNQSQTPNQLPPVNQIPSQNSHQQPLSNQVLHTQPTPTPFPNQVGNMTHLNTQQMTPINQQQYAAAQRSNQFTPTSSPRPPGPYSGFNQPPSDPPQHPAWNTPTVGNFSQTQQGNVQHMPQRYPQQVNFQGPSAVGGLTTQMSGLSVTQTGFNKLWGHDACDLLQNRNILPPEKIEAPKVKLNQEFLDSVNCSPDIFRCTLTKIPETNSLLQKSRLPLGILIHPFRDLNHLAVIQCSTIVRCRSCRTYINPFVYFVDHKRWKCNLCFRANELPEEFQYDPVSKSFGDPSRRPEIKSSTIEFIAPSEYMLRPPQPAVYLFLLDVSSIAVESGYLGLLCSVLLDEIDRLPGDGRTQIGFITFDSSVHFYNMAEGLSQPQQMVVVDIEDVFLPCPDNLLVNLAECRELVKDLLQQLPQKFAASHDNVSALGAALQAAYKLMSPTGGRVTVFQACLPNSGPGSLTTREDPSQRAGKEAPHLNPATDFYKRLALDCSGQQIAVDLFLVNGQYSDLATLSGIARFSGGCIHHFPLFKKTNELQAESLQRTIKRYLSRKIGFEAVMRIRCSRGLAIHTFHGNFFVRSTDLLSLPNVNPDAGFGMQISVEESLSDLQTVCFQAALLYTSSKGERRIRVHTLCLPVANTLSDILHSADQQCIIGLLAKMAVDRSHQTSLSDARDAFINVAIDVLSAYRLAQGSAASGGLVAPINLRLLPLYILALLKYTAFRTGQSTRLDDRLFAMCQMKTLPLAMLIKTIYPDLYPVHNLTEQNSIQIDGEVIPQAPRLHLSAEKLDFRGAFLMDTGEHMMIYIGRNIPAEFCCNVLGVQAFNLISDSMYELPALDTPDSERLRKFINHLQSEKPFPATLQIIRDDSQHRSKFLERLIEDRTESAMSYYEFLQHLKSNMK